MPREIQLPTTAENRYIYQCLYLEAHEPIHFPDQNQIWNERVYQR